MARALLAIAGPTFLQREQGWLLSDASQCQPAAPHNKQKKATANLWGSRVELRSRQRDRARAPTPRLRKFVPSDGLLSSTSINSSFPPSPPPPAINLSRHHHCRAAFPSPAPPGESAPPKAPPTSSS